MHTSTKIDSHGTQDDMYYDVRYLSYNEVDHDGNAIVIQFKGKSRRWGSTKHNDPPNDLWVGSSCPDITVLVCLCKVPVLYRTVCVASSRFTSCLLDCASMWGRLEIFFCLFYRLYFFLDLGRLIEFRPFFMHVFFLNNGRTRCKANHGSIGIFMLCLGKKVHVQHSRPDSCALLSALLKFLVQQHLHLVPNFPCVPSPRVG